MATWNKESRQIELLAWAKQGVTECLRSTRGANMFGAGARVKALSNTVLQIETHEEGVSGPVFWELKLTQPYS